MIIKVILHNKILVNKECRYVLFKNEDGESGLLKSHVSTIFLGKDGFLKIEDANSNIDYVVYKNAMFKFNENKAVLLASIGACGKTLEEAQSAFQIEMKKRTSLTKQENMDFSKLEKELFDNIKKGKAGRL